MSRVMLLPYTIALTLSFHGLRSGSLSPSGAICAFVVGSCMLEGVLWAFGVTLIMFYLVGSAATRYGTQLKAQVEHGHRKAGYRTAQQVLCNSLSAFVACLLWNAHFASNSVLSRLFSRVHVIQQIPYDGTVWCPLSTSVAGGWSRAFLFAALGHFACCMGDTLASELGILSTSPPILITTMKAVPRGTNGGISSLGTLASVGGGLLMGVTLAMCLVFESAACWERRQEILALLASYGCFAGFFGSMLDSLMGATIQRTRYATEEKMILQDDSEPPASADIKVISGLDILTNNQVNLVSSVFTSIGLGYIAFIS